MHCVNRFKYRIIVHMVRFSLRRLLFDFFFFYIKCNSQKESCAFNFSEHVAIFFLGQERGKRLVRLAVMMYVLTGAILYSRINY